MALWCYIGMEREWTVFTSHAGALRCAVGRNRLAGKKYWKVVMHRRHFVVVDYTWERNT